MVRRAGRAGRLVGELSHTRWERSHRAATGTLFRMLPEYQHDALLRLKTVRGHIDGVISMVESSAYCADVMKQIAAMQASLEKVNRVLLENHLQTCVTEAIQSGEGGIEKVRELISALRFNGSLTDFRDRAEPLPAPVPVPVPE